MSRFVAYAFFALLAVLLGSHFVSAFRSAIQREKDTACLDLEPRLDGREAFAFEKKDFFGTGNVSLSTLKGKLVFLNFWATWCPPCVDEMPSMEALAVRFKDQSFSMVAVSVDEKDDEVRRFFPKGTAMTVVRDAGKEVSRRYGTDKYPETYLIDGNGKILYHFINKRDWNHPAAARCIEAHLDS